VFFLYSKLSSTPMEWQMRGCTFFLRAMGVEESFE